VDAGTMTRLRRLLDSISPDQMSDRILRLVDEALNSFPQRQAVVRSGTEFRAVIINAWRHVHAQVWDACFDAASPQSELEWAQAERILNNIYGGREGWKTAMELAHTGVEGGLPGVLRRFAAAAAKLQMEGWIEAGVDAFWHASTFEERLSAVEAYLTEFSPLLPAELLERDPVLLLDEFPRILKHHPEVLLQVRRLPRR